MNACGVILPDDLASMGSPYVSRQYAGNEARRHIVTHRAQAVVDALGLTTGHVLDVGCGPGFASVLLAQRVTHVTALDIDPVKLRIARRLAQMNRVSLDVLLCDASASLPFPGNHFDGLVSLELIEHLRDWQSVVGEMSRVVRPGGRLAVSTPARYGLAQIVKTLAHKTGAKEIDTYEWFIPRRQMIREMESHGLRITGLTDVVLTAPMLPDSLMPLVRGIERFSERSRVLSRLCSTTVYCGEKPG